MRNIVIESLLMCTIVEEMSESWILVCKNGRKVDGCFNDSVERTLDSLMAVAMWMYRRAEVK